MDDEQDVHEINAQSEFEKENQSRSADDLNDIEESDEEESGRRAEGLTIITPNTLPMNETSKLLDHWKKADWTVMVFPSFSPIIGG